MAAKITQSRTIPNTSLSTNQSTKRQRFISSEDEDSDSAPRKQCRRVSKACERCRLKKTKCDGEMPCRRCTDDMVICCEGARKKGSPKTVAESCVELLEFQQSKFIAGHLKMYKIMVDAGIWPFGEVRRNNRGIPIVHDMLEKIGVLRFGTEFPNGFPETPDENRAIRQQFEATKVRDISEKSKVDFQKLATESSPTPPSLTHTDRESSIETCYSEAKPSVEIDFNTLTSGPAMDLISGFQQDLQESYWNLNTSNNEEMRSSIAASSNPALLSPMNSLCFNQDVQSRCKAPINSSLWNRNGVEADHSIIAYRNSLHSTVPTSTQSKNIYGILISTRKSFNNQESLMSTKVPEYAEVNNEIMPIGMRYGYDPYMG